MQAILGVIFHFTGGFASGSFYVPYRRVRGWAWECFWIVVGLVSWLIVPFLAAEFLNITRVADPSTAYWICMLGVLWGVLLGEWKGVHKRTFATIVSGIAVIILSVTIVGYGNSI